jgi:hypothetical protein
MAECASVLSGNGVMKRGPGIEPSIADEQKAVGVKKST